MRQKQHLKMNLIQSKKKKRFGILFNSMTDFYLFKVVSKSEFMFPLCVYTSQGF